MKVSDSFRSVANDFLRWYREVSLPLWASTGIDAARGASVERLLPNGQPDTDADLRIRVQARQVYCFGVAETYGWYPGAADIVRSIVGFMERHGRSRKRPGYLLSISNATLDIVDERFDLYDHAFFLLADAWRYKLFATPAALDDAHAVMDALDARLGVAAGWLEGDYPHTHRRQNPHMHLLEAFLTLYEVSGEKRWFELSEKVMNLFLTRFLVDEHSVILEYFDSELNPTQDELGLTTEPGHSMEWVWLLHWYQRIVGGDFSDLIERLYDTAIRNGIAPTGVMYDELYPDGRVKDDGMRLWPMTEHIRASLLQAGAGNTAAEEHAKNAILKLNEYFLNTSTPGSFIDRRDGQGNITVGRAPTTSVYHLTGAAIEVHEYLSR